MNYRREIDGLRAVAVIPVLLFHAGFEFFGGGFVGVDVFFVISGYLITSIILAEKQAGTFSILGFYERRARRILPALFVVMLACMPFALRWMSPSELRDFSKSIAAVCTFSSNVLFFMQSGYFDSATELKPLLHTWSLAVEEQYYLLYPVFLMLAWRFGKRWIIGILAGTAVVSLIAAHWGATHQPAATFYLLPTRGWELLIGSFVAFYHVHAPEAARQTPEKLGQPLSLAGLLLILVAIFAFNKTTPFPSLYALIPTLGAALVILYATPGTIAGRLLGSQLLVGAGLISYSAYLWHQPIFAFVRIATGQLSPVMAIASIAASFVLAYFSWKYVERPFRRKHFIARNTLLRLSAASLCAFFLVGAFLVRSTNALLGPVTPKPSDEFQQVDACFLLNTGVEALDEKRCGLSARNGHMRVLLIGDSHAASLYPGLREYLATKDISLSMATAAFCLPLVTDFPANTSRTATKRCAKINERVHDILKSQQFDLVLVSSYILEWGFDRNPKWTYPGYYGDYINELKKLRANNKVIVIGQFPVWSEGLPNVIAKEIKWGSTLATVPNFSDKGLKDGLFELDDRMQGELQRIDVKYISVLKGLCASNSCRRYVTTDGGPQLMAVDYGHLSLFGSKYVGSQVVGPYVMRFLGQS